MQDSTRGHDREDRPRKAPGAFLVVGIVAIVAGGLASGLVPDLFAAVGGWATVAVVTVLALGIGTFQLLRFMRQGAARDDVHD